MPPFLFASYATATARRSWTGAWYVPLPYGVVHANCHGTRIMAPGGDFAFAVAKITVASNPSRLRFAPCVSVADTD